MQQLIAAFNHTMSGPYNTVLEGGANEPLYQPAVLDQDHHKIIFTRDYFSSALHEISHWCVAGSERRLLVDYGYWYAPDGRTMEQQKLFERVEVKPQALEWIFSNACGVPFRVSADNLESQLGPSVEFVNNIVEQAQRYCYEGLPKRASLLADMFARTFFLRAHNSDLDTAFPLDTKEMYLAPSMYHAQYFSNK